MKQAIVGLILLVLLTVGQVGALEETITLSVSDNNADYLYQEGLVQESGFRGQPELRLRDAEYQVTNQTDLLLHFDKTNDLQDGGFYDTGRIKPTLTGAVKRMGSAAAQFNAERGLTISPRNGALFFPGTFAQSFSIEFWYYAGATVDGQYIFRWDGQAWLGQKRIIQHVSAAIRNRGLVWTFTNFFVNPGASANSQNIDFPTLSFKMSNRREFLPRQWYHHLLRYDAQRGLLEYLVNGTSEDVKYATSTGRESGQVYQAYVGERSAPKIIIGQNAVGFLDEFRISRNWVAEPGLEAKSVPGYVIFKPIEFTYIGAGSKIIRIDATKSLPGTTGLGFYYMMLDQKFPPARLLRDDSRWRRFQPGRPITNNNTGLWLYIKVEFLPDGAGKDSPSLQALQIAYQPDPPPPPPSGLKAVPGDRSITLSWNPVPAPDIQGYMVYYGTKPGQYFGTQATQGTSPINVGNVVTFTIDGLENNRIYYFMVASYDRSNAPELGLELKRGVTAEVSARPARSDNE